MIKKFNEMFDDEELKNKFEIPYLQGEFTPGNPNLKPYSKRTDKITEQTELKKMTFRFPILNDFHKVTRRIGGINVYSFYATSLESVEGDEYYAQLAFAYTNERYHVNSLFRLLDEYEMPENWMVHDFIFDSIEEVYEVTREFLKACISVNVIRPEDLGNPVVNN
jgi:hypothetical protein